MPLTLGAERHDTSALLILLHGLGADARDLLPLAQALAKPGLRILLPNAPSLPVTINGGMSMPAWYDIASMTIDQKVDITGITHATTQIQSLIKKELDALSTNTRAILGGFSQGGVIALQAGLSMHEVCGVIGLSCYLPFLPRFNHNVKADTAKQILLCHGLHDMVVPITLGRQAKASLEEQGFSVHYHEYSIEHTITLEEVENIKSFLSKVLS